MKNIYSYALASALLVGSQFAGAVPENCVYGRAKVDFDSGSSLDNITLTTNFDVPFTSFAHQLEVSGTLAGAPINNLAVGYDSGEFYYIPREYHDGKVEGTVYDHIFEAAWAFVEGEGNIKLTGPTQVALNEYTRFKVSTGIRAFSYAKFYNSEVGFVGKDKSNIEANAYKHMKFSTLGPSVAWGTSDGLCSAKAVVVQEKPSLSVTYDNITKLLSFKYSISPYSKAAQLNVAPKIKLSYKGGSEKTVELPTAELVQASFYTKGNDINFVTAGEVTVWSPMYPGGSVTATIDDGGFVAADTYKHYGLLIGTYSGGFSAGQQQAISDQATIGFGTPVPPEEHKYTDSYKTGYAEGYLSMFGIVSN